MVGSVYAFRTAPLFAFAPGSTGRYGAVKVLGVNKEHVVVAALDAVWWHQPSLSEVARCKIMQEQRFYSSGKRAVWGVDTDQWNTANLDEMTLLGTIPTDGEEAELRDKIFHYLTGSRFTTLNYANIAVEAEWRWKNDRETLIAEQTRSDEERIAKIAVEERRLKERLRGLTWDQLLSERTFAQWAATAPLPPEDFADKAREVIREACRTLQALGEKPRRADVRKVLRSCVEWFNDADEQAGHVIESQERDDICSVLEEMAYVAGQKRLAEEIHEWRTW